MKTPSRSMYRRLVLGQAAWTVACLVLLILMVLNGGARWSAIPVLLCFSPWFVLGHFRLRVLNELVRHHINRAAVDAAVEKAEFSKLVRGLRDELSARQQGTGMEKEILAELAAMENHLVSLLSNHFREVTTGLRGHGDRISRESASISDRAELAFRELQEGQDSLFASLAASSRAVARLGHESKAMRRIYRIERVAMRAELQKLDDRLAQCVRHEILEGIENGAMSVRRLLSAMATMREGLVASVGEIHEAVNSLSEKNSEIAALHTGMLESSQSSQNSLHRGMAMSTQHLEALRDSIDVSHRDLRAQLEVLLEQAHSYGDDVTAQLQRTLQAVADIDSALEQDRGTVSSGFLATRVSLEQLPQATADFLTLRERLAPPSLDTPLVGGWAATAPTISVVARRIINSPRPLTVVELGSGVSTLWTCLAMQYIERGSCISLEHEETYCSQTRKLLVAAGVDEWGQVLHSPLKDTLVDGQTFSWYDLSVLPDCMPPIDILVVDGPPATCRSDSRYPAIPMLIDRLSDDAWVVLDDTIRLGERKIMDDWLKADPRLSVSRNLGKSTLLIRQVDQP